MMSGAFRYKPKFVDIRIRPPKPEEEGRKPDETDLKPGERPCEWTDCRAAATARAPKSREHLDDHYWFCQAHAGEYNRNWNFFEGMSEAQVAAAQAARATGERPTWQFKASKFSREAASFAYRANQGQGFADPFDLLGRRARAAQAARDNPRRMGRLETKALAELDLDETADKTTIRSRYTELVKRCHPDANGGDRSAEHRLQRVIKAYRTLRQAGLV
jgi:DnaJ-domain-containing protein 1